MFAFVDEGALDLFCGTITLGYLHAVADAAEVQLRGWCALARKGAVGSEDDIELAIDIDDVALAQSAGQNFRHGIREGERGSWGVPITCDGLPVQSVGMCDP